MVVIWSDWKRYLLDWSETCQEKFKISWLKEEICLQKYFFLDVRHYFCMLQFSHKHNLRVILTPLLSEMYATESSLRSLAIVCDYRETTLFAIVCVECDLRFAIRDRLRSFAIIWKPALKHFLRARINDAWPLVKFTLCEKQKYQVAFVTKNKISHFICIQLAHELFQTSRLISSIT